ncbi:hypothetical protein uav_052 [Pseudomonas phage UAVern]|uniref:Uncharacterized protein n=1 Tax=Pseudomonas phage UAVern TaxID=2856997 RepID=A0A975YYM7_9CAUD|nr:hypothetical protein uav_052 [Pseudomonas phage UAVern]
MTPEQFCYWLQGFVELNPNAMLTLTQWQIVKDHLAQVFKKETPDRRIPLPVSPRPTESVLDRLLDTPFKQPSWALPNTQWPPGTVIC